jgi:hypothetical protein
LSPTEAEIRHYSLLVEGVVLANRMWKRDRGRVATGAESTGSGHDDIIKAARQVELLLQFPHLTWLEVDPKLAGETVYAVYLAQTVAIRDLDGSSYPINNAHHLPHRIAVEWLLPEEIADALKRRPQTDMVND